VSRLLLRGMLWAQAWPVTTESLAPNDVVVSGRGLKLSRDSDRDSRHHHQQYSTAGGILPVAESNQANEGGRTG